MDSREFASRVRRRRPFVLRRWSWLEQDSPWRSLSALRRLLGPATDRRVDVACTAPGSPFAGDPRKHQSVSLRLADFLDVVHAANTGGSHWALGRSLQFYLCQAPVPLAGPPLRCWQCCIVSNEPEIPAGLPELAAHLPFPSWMTGRGLSRANLWVCADQSTTTAHYDGTDNVLLVTAGAKRVELWPPSARTAVPVWFEAPNHAEGPPRSPPVRTVLLEAGSVLWIPEGWWHKVHSQPGTVAVNLWSRSLGHRLGKPSGLIGRGCVDYYVRVLLSRQLKSAKARHCHATARKARANLRRRRLETPRAVRRRQWMLGARAPLWGGTGAVVEGLEALGVPGRRRS